jgi:hypothetical protein
MKHEEFESYIEEYSYFQNLAEINEYISNKSVINETLDVCFHFGHQELGIIIVLYNENLDTDVDSDFFKSAISHNCLKVLQAVWENSIITSDQPVENKKYSVKKSLKGRKSSFSRKFSFKLPNPFGTQKQRKKENSFNISDIIIHFKENEKLNEIRYILVIQRGIKMEVS